MERHGHHQPAPGDLQQPDPRGSAGTAVGRISRRRILPVLCGQWPADFRPRSSTMSAAKNKVMSMTRNIVLAAVLMAGTLPARAATEAEFKSAMSAAEAAEKQADQLRNKWITTETQLAAAKKAAAAGDFDAAIAAAREAEALAIASIYQAT